MLNSKSEKFYPLEEVMQQTLEKLTAPSIASSIRKMVQKLFFITFNEPDRETAEGEGGREEEVELMDDGTPANLQH